MSFFISQNKLDKIHQDCIRAAFRNADKRVEFWRSRWKSAEMAARDAVHAAEILQDQLDAANLTITHLSADLAEASKNDHRDPDTGRFVSAKEMEVRLGARIGGGNE